MEATKDWERRRSTAAGIGQLFDPTAPQDSRAVIADDGLSGRNSVARLVELDMKPFCGQSRHGRGLGRTIVADLDEACGWLLDGNVR